MIRAANSRFGSKYFSVATQFVPGAIITHLYCIRFFLKSYAIYSINTLVLKLTANFIVTQLYYISILGITFS